MTLSKFSSPSPRLWFCLVMTLIAFALLASVPASAAPQGAAFTTFDTTLKGCLDGKNPNGVDCHNYAAKPDVFINGGPRGGQGDLSAGCYYFVVLNPGAQNGATSNSIPGIQDGAGSLNSGNPSNLSDNSNADGDAGGSPEASDGAVGDVWTNRIFHVSSGAYSIDETYATDCGAGGGTPHATGSDPSGHTIIQLFPYDDTGNPAGEYSVGVCQVLGSNGLPYVQGSNDTPFPSTSPSTCKFDAFKVKTTTPCTVNCGGNGQPSQATITACKFWDVNLEHLYDPDAPDPYIGGWPLTATITGGDSNAYLGNTPGTTTLTQDTSDTVDSTVTPPAPGLGFGCTTFAVNWPASNSQTAVNLSFSEANLPDSNVSPIYACDMVAQTCSLLPAGNWQQSAPYNFTTNAVDDSLDNTSLSPNQNTNVTYDFGNFIGQDLTVSKTATPSFTRTYTWSISKSVDKTLVEQIGGSATFNYTVVASQTGFTDSAWSVSGNITVTNPNGFAVTGVTVTDAVDDGGNCSVTDTNAGVNETVPANDSLIVPYTCTYTSASTTPPDGTNTATATWDKTAFATVHSSATGTASVVFSTAAPTTTVNKTIHVTDSYAGALGTCTATNASPFASCTFKYSRTINVTAGCNKYDNTATITETGQYANAEVEVCGPAATGALTMGFWQNKNGQGIISGGASVSGVCKSGTWLRQYPPFQDLSSTATCAQVATYVYNVIKAATCSGTTQPCNAMLKAQMLATALDVYFSDPALGGNRIGAPSPIGAQKIDLTKVCSMIDGSGGSATCSGSFLNCSSAFGGATCLTVSQILAYAGSQSNVGGSTWYANVKATQVLAKNVFDAINNRVAFNCP